MIEAWAHKTGGTYESAAADLVKHRHILEEFNVKKSRLKTFSFDKFEGRLKFKKKLLERVWDKIPYQSQLQELNSMMSGKDTRKATLSAFAAYQWPRGMLMLYVLEEGNWEMKKIKNKFKKENSNNTSNNTSKNSNKSKKSEEKELKKSIEYRLYKYLLKEREMFFDIYVDEMFLSKNKDMRSYILDKLELRLNKEINPAQKPFYVFYNSDRTTLVSEDTRYARTIRIIIIVKEKEKRKVKMVEIVMRITTARNGCHVHFCCTSSAV